MKFSNWAERRRYYRAQHNARNRVRHAIKHGLLQRPQLCQGCGDAGRIEAHHEDYGKPLDVLFLCSSCHRLHHRLRNFGRGNVAMPAPHVTPAPPIDWDNLAKVSR